MKSSDHPLLYKVTLTLLFSVLFVISMYYAKPILVPITVAALLAMLLLPLVQRLEKWKMGKILPIVLSILVVLAVLIGVIYLLSSQVLGFTDDLPLIQEKLNERFADLQVWIGEITGLSGEEQLRYLKQAASSLLGVAQSFATGLLAATTGAIVFIGLQVVFIFLFLYYRHRIRIFLLKIIPKEEHDNAKDIIKQISRVTQKYLLGVFVVMGILSVLNSIVFLLIGVPHAIFFGVMASILNIIPYLGVWIGTALPMIMVVITQDSFTPVLFIILGVWVNQQIDNNFLTPKITGSQVAINPLATILVLIIGSMIWGVAGMILFIPLLGVAKIVFDNVKGLEPLGYLVGEDRSDQPSRFIRILQKARRKRSK